MIDSVAEFKEKGNQLFKSQEYSKAINIYKQALNQIDNSTEIKVVFYSNICACYLKLCDYDNVIKYSTMVLDLDHVHQKSLYRRSLAYEHSKKYMNAFTDIKFLVSLNPDEISFKERAKNLYGMAQQELAKINDPLVVFTDLLNSKLLTKTHDGDKNMLLMGNDQSIRGRIYSSENVKNIFIAITSSEELEFFFQLLCCYVKKNYHGTKIATELCFTLNIESIIKKSLTDSMIDFIAHCTENLVTQYTKENKEPTMEQVFAVRHDYFKKFITFLQHDKFIKTYFDLPFHQLVNKSLSFESKIHVARVVYRILNFHHYIPIFAIDHSLIKEIILCVIPNEANGQYWNSYQENKMLSNLISGNLATVYESVKTDQGYAKKFLDSVEKTLETITSLNDKYNFKLLITFSPLINVDLDVSTDLLVTSSKKYGEKIIDIFIKNVHDKDFSRDLVSFPSYFLIFVCELLVGFQNCQKFRENPNLMTPCLDIFKFCYSHPDQGVRNMGLLGLARQIPTEDSSELCKEYFNKVKEIMDDSSINNQSLGLEILAFLSLNADIKEMIISDPALIQSLYDLTLKTCKLINVSKDESFKSLDNMRYLPTLFSAVSLLANLINIKQPGSKLQRGGDEDNKKELKKLATSVGQPLPKKHPKDKKQFIENRIKKISDDRLFSLLSNIVSCLKICDTHRFIHKSMLSVQSPFYLASIYYITLKDYDVRGMAVQAGAVKSLLTLSSDLKIGDHLPSQSLAYSDSPYIAANALALIAIAFNPSVCFNNQSILDSIVPLLCTCEFDQPVLRQYEGLLALTNVVSLNDEVRDYVTNLDGAYQIIETCLLDENELIKRASLELITNLSLSQKFVEKYFCPPSFESQKNIPTSDRDRKAERIRMFVLLAGETETKDIAIVALSVLSLLSLHPIPSQYMVDLDVFYEIIKELIELIDDEITYRVVFIIKNILTHDSTSIDIFNRHFKKDFVNIKKNTADRRTLEILNYILNLHKN